MYARRKSVVLLPRRSIVQISEEFFIPPLLFGYPISRSSRVVHHPFVQFANKISKPSWRIYPLDRMGRGFSILGNIKGEEQRVEKFRLKKFKLANLRTELAIDILRYNGVIWNANSF